MNVQKTQPLGTTYVVVPAWLQSAWEGGSAYFVACDVATGATLAEADDVTALVATMTEKHPAYALVSNSVTEAHGVQSALRDVPAKERL